MKLYYLDNLYWDLISDPYNTVVVDRCTLKNHFCYDFEIGTHHPDRLNYFAEKNLIGREYFELEKKNTHTIWYTPTTQDELDQKVSLIRTLLHDSNVFVIEKNKHSLPYNVSSKYPLIFVHTPKTAGTSMNKVLDIGEDFGGHRKLTQLRTLLDESTYQSYKKMSVIRNPFDRIVSLYKATEPQMIQLAKDEQNVRDWPTGSDEEQYTFESWFWDITSHVNNITSEPLFYAPCYDLMVDEKGELAIDYIIRYENLEKDFKNMFDDMKIEAPELPKLNVATIKHPDMFKPGLHYSKYYDCHTKNVMIEFIYELFEKDFKAFGYEFEDK